MKVEHTKNAPCCMTRGQVRRVPQDRTQSILGYHVACPSCGYVTLLLHGRLGVFLCESEDGQLSTAKPHACLFCHTMHQIEQDHFIDMRA
jgi:hypothetical protein